MRRFPFAVLLALLGLVGSGCSHVGWSGQTLSYGARADVVHDLETAVVTHSIPAAERPVRIRNLAGSITLVTGTGPDVEIEARVHAKGATPEATERLLDGMTWSTRLDDRGRNEWTLSYPVEAYSTFHYSTEGSGLSVRTKRFYGRTVRVTTEREPGVPTLFADLTITYPPHAALHVRNMAGPLRGGDLEGTADLTVIVGDVTLGSFHGALNVDTGSGDIDVQRLDGRTHLDTGSGSITVAAVAGTAHFDTGSGDVLVGSADAERVHADSGSGRIVFEGGRIGELHVDTGSGAIAVHGVGVEIAHADTGSGSITIDGDLSRARRVHAGTGSGRVTILGGPDASFEATASQGSGRFVVRYDDARLQTDGRRVVSARRGDGRTVIRMDSGSGDCILGP